jgi:hypothetical protein
MSCLVDNHHLQIEKPGIEPGFFIFVQEFISVLLLIAGRNRDQSR